MALQSFPYFSLYCTGKAARDMICQVLAKEEVFIFNPLTPMSDQDRIFPYNINTIPIR